MTIEECLAMEESLKKARKENAGALVNAMIKRCLDIPGVLAVAWTQGTPSFNDGAPCVFSVHDPQFRFEWTEVDLGDPEDPDYEEPGIGELEDQYDYVGNHTLNATPDGPRKDTLVAAREWAGQMQLLHELLELQYDDARIHASRNDNIGITIDTEEWYDY